MLMQISNKYNVYQLGKVKSHSVNDKCTKIPATNQSNSTFRVETIDTEH